MELQPIHQEPKSFIRKYLFSIDHKMIAKQFLWTGLIFLLLGGTLAMLIRWQWAYPQQPVPALGNLVFKDTGGAITPPTYTSIFTMHGLIMIFWAITPVLIGAFGNLTIPLMIGARDMAFPKLNMYSYWTFVISSVLVLLSFSSQLGAGNAGWTTYPPLSTGVGSPGWGQTFAGLAIFVTGISSIMGGINYIVTVIRFRAPGMTWFRLPLTVWGLWLTSILNVLFIPVLGSGALLLTFDRLFGTHFFIAGGAVGVKGGDPILFQHLFWIFGHPEVYILILPAWGIVGDILSFFARKPAFWYKGSVFAMIGVSVLSAVVYGHHMYQTGMAPMLGLAFEILTLAISVPAVLLFVNWLNTIWRGSIRPRVPMLFAMGMVFVFGAGGLTGLLLGTISTDIYLHDTMYVVGHFHLTMAAASFLASFAGLYFWFPKMFGRETNETLGKIHFWGSVTFITLTFFGQMAAGYSGQHRRLFDPFQYDYISHLRGINRLTSYSAFMLGLSQIPFIINFFYSVFAGKKAKQNPWDVTTLEWTHCDSPPVYHNFTVVPTVVRGPHEFANPDVKKALGKDWLGQAEELPGAAEGAVPVAAEE
ncbi:MAG: cbb3-type cytochrome c oxidase subunit I [Polyangiaceae bacterium]